MAAAALEEILGRLLVPDNTVIQQATKDLQAVFKDPAMVGALCEVLLSSQNPQIRQYAAVLLRKKMTQIWKQLSQETQVTIKTTILQTLSQENIRLVLHSIAHLVAVIVKKDYCSGVRWSNLNTFILQHWSSDQSAHKQLAMLLLSKLMDTAAYYYHGDGQFPNLFQLFSSSLDQLTDHTVTYYTLKALTAMVPYVGSDDMIVFRQMIPQIMRAVSSLVEHDEDRACEGMELFDELIESDVGIIVTHLPALIQWCLQMAANTALGNNIRVKALSFISWLASLKKKALLKQGLLPTILQTMLTIMAVPSDEDHEAEEGSQSPTTLAAQVLDTLSNHLPPDKLFTPLMQLLSPWVQSSDEHQRSASLVAIAVIAEGCSEHIRHHHLKSLLEVVYKAVRDDSQVVRNSALFAIGQFAEYLQPEICEYSGDLMPMLLQFLDTAIARQGEGLTSSSVTKIFYALESFIEQLGARLEHYLPALIDRLFLALEHCKSVTIQELVVSAFGAAASSCEDKLTPYFTRIVQVLKGFISLPNTADNAVLHAQAIDTLGTLARTIGGDTFKPLAQDCLELGMNLMMSDDPDIRRSVYGMLASLSCVWGEELGPYLPAIIERMLQSLTSDEGVKIHYASFDMSFFDFGDEEDVGGADMEATNDEEEGIEGYSVENSYLDEKEDTCNSLGEIAENVKGQFLPYIDNCFQELSVLTEHSVEGIRKAAIWTQGRLCKVWYRCVATDEARQDLQALINSTLLSFAATVRTDADRSVVIATLETLEELLKALREFSPFPLNERALTSLLVSLQDLFNNKAQCQEEDEDSSDELSEYDSVLVECGGSVLGPLAAAVGGISFLPHLPDILPPVVAKLNGSEGDQSFAIGTLAEIVDGLGSCACHVINLYPTFIEYSSRQREEEVCSNAVYGLGLLVANGGPELLSKYGVSLQHLFGVLESYKDAKSRRIVDNVCGAVCRMISAHQDAVPLEQVLPVLLNSLPLVEDMEEHPTVYSCLQQLLAIRNPPMMSQLPSFLRVLAHDLAPGSQLPKEMRGELCGLLCALNRECPNELSTASAQLSPSDLQLLTNIINS